MRLTNLKILTECLNDISIRNSKSVNIPFSNITKSKTFELLTVDKGHSFEYRFIQWALKRGYARKPFGYMTILTELGRGLANGE